MNRAKRSRALALLEDIERGLEAVRELRTLLAEPAPQRRLRVLPPVAPEVSDTDAAFAARELQKRGW